MLDELMYDQLKELMENDRILASRTWKVSREEIENKMGEVIELLTKEYYDRVS